MRFLKNLCGITLTGLIMFTSCGKDGETGPEGPQGPQGPSGPNGLKSLLDVQPLAAGTQCSNGGVVVKAGIDKNSNGKLDNDEVENTQYVCNGAAGNYDKQIIIPLYDGSLIANNRSIQHLIFKDFNIANYAGVDSVVLYSRINSANGQTWVPATMALFNLTDNTLITDSEVTSLTTSTNFNIIPLYTNSKNCFKSFPINNISLGLQFTCNEGTGGATSTYMVLYRK